jgi:hypothetical protein
MAERGGGAVGGLSSTVTAMADLGFWGLLWLFFSADLEGRLGTAAGS